MQNENSTLGLRLFTLINFKKACAWIKNEGTMQATVKISHLIEKRQKLIRRK